MRRVVHLNCASLSGMYKIDHNMAPPFARQGLVACAGLPVPVKCQTVSWYMTGAFGPPLLYTTNACFILGRCNTYLFVVVVVVVVAATRTVPSKVYCTFLSYRPRGYPEATPRLPGAAIKICRWPSLHPRCRARRRSSVSVAVPLLLLLFCWTPPWSPLSRRQLCSCRWVPQPTP